MNKTLLSQNRSKSTNTEYKYVEQGDAKPLDKNKLSFKLILIKIININFAANLVAKSTNSTKYFQAKVIKVISDSEQNISVCHFHIDSGWIMPKDRIYLQELHFEVVDLYLHETFYAHDCVLNHLVGLNFCCPLLP